MARCRMVMFELVVNKLYINLKVLRVGRNNVERVQLIYSKDKQILV